MQVVSITDVDEIRHLTKADPVPIVSQSLIRVHVVGLNRLDLLMLHGDLSVPLPHTPGSDLVGSVVDSPSGRFPSGARVLVNPALPEQPDTSWPPSRECEYVRILGCHTQGALAEYVLVPDEQLYPVPDALSDSEAATLPLDYLTAWRMLVSKAQVEAGDRVVVWGASGSLGCAAIAILSHLGATPIALVGRSSDAEVLRQHGAAVCIDYRSPDLLARVRNVTDGGPTVVFESVGSSTWQATQEMVRQGGRIVICGTTSGGVAPTDLEELYYKQVSVHGSRMGYPAEFEAMLQAVREGGLRPAPIALTVPFSEAERGLAYLETRVRPGKVLVQL